MSKYYDKELPATVYVTYGERYSGRTYREFEKLQKENEMLRAAWDDIFKKWESQVHIVGKAIEYIEENVDGNKFETSDDVIILYNYIEDLIKILRGEIK